MDVLLNLKHIFDIQIINTFLLLITYIPLNVFLFNYTSNISRYFILFFGTSFIFLSFFIIERLLYFKYKIYINYIKNLKLFIIIGLLNSIKDIIYVYYFTNPNINELFLLIPLIPNMITSIFFTKKIILNKRYVNFLQCDIIILLGIFFLITIAYARSVYTNKFQFDNITLINSTIYVIGTIIETISNLLIEKLNENIGLQQEQQLYDKYNSNFFEKKYNYVFIVLNTVAYEFIFISLLFWVNLIPPFGRSLDLINFWNHLTQSIFFIDYKIIIYILSIITFIYFQTEIVSNSANLYSYTKSILAIIIIIIYTIKKVDISIFFIITTILYIFIISVNIILLRKMELGRQIEDEIKSLINNN